MNRLGLHKAGARIGLALVAPAGLLICLAGPAFAQSFPIDPFKPENVAKEPIETQAQGMEEVGRTADTGIGEVGERTQVLVNADPMGRINSRIRNRVQNRIRNRIDRNYDPMANATSPFELADQEARKGAPR